jgi:nitrogen fixation protein FixH
VRPFERLRPHKKPTKPVTGRAVLFALVGFFGVVIAINAVMAVLAVRTMPGTESDTPYQDGIGYNAEIAAAHDQAARGWRVAGRVDRGGDGRATVTVEAHDSGGAPLPGLAFTARLVRPTDKRIDRIVPLIERGRGRYVGEAADVSPGLWLVEFEADQGAGGIPMFRSNNRITLD